MYISNFSKGEEVVHKRYGLCTVIEKHPPVEKYKGGLLLEGFSEKDLRILNSDRQIKNMPKTGDIKRCFEDNLDLLVKL